MHLLSRNIITPSIRKDVHCLPTHVNNVEVLQFFMTGEVLAVAGHVVQ